MKRTGIREILLLYPLLHLALLNIFPLISPFLFSFHLFSNPLDYLLLLITVQTGALSPVLLSTLCKASFPVITRCSPCSVFLSSLIPSCYEPTVKPHISSWKNYLSSCSKQSNYTGNLLSIINVLAAPHFHYCLPFNQSILISRSTIRLR